MFSLFSLFPKFRKPQKPEYTIFLELHNMSGYTYRLKGHGSPLIFTLEIDGMTKAVLSDFTKDYYAADAFTRYLLNHSVKPEQLPQAAAAFSMQKIP
ncbi:MAG: hypothetical protein V3G42_05325 [Oscillospiraceae bacterium]